MTDRLVSRRRVLGQTVALAAMVKMLGGQAVAASQAPRPSVPGKRAEGPPNILFIMADDLGYADLSCYGRRDFQTPHIDSLARDGVRFTDAYANAPVCSATRTALMTGRYQYRLPVGLEEPLAFRPLGLPPSHPSLPSLLRAEGYETSLIGKWHLGNPPSYGPNQSGYDHFWGFLGGGVDYFTHKELSGKPGLFHNDNPVEAEGYLTDLLTDETIKTIDRSKQNGKPFFISLHYNAPHWPWEGPDDQEEAKRLEGGPPFGLFHYDGGSQRIYAQMVTRMDSQIGRLLEHLERLGMADNTLIVFTSDNGGERYSDTWPFTGRKTELLEGGIRIPTIVRWPGHAPAGSVSAQTIMSMDWVPTLLAAAGAAPDPAYPSDGIDLTGNIAAPQSVQERTLFWRYKWQQQEACRQGPWKYLKIRDNSFLFNIEEDPLERANLRLRMPEKFAELKSAYDSWNAQMLPLDPQSGTGGNTGEHMADRFGVDDPSYR